MIFFVVPAIVAIGAASVWLRIKSNKPREVIGSELPGFDTLYRHRKMLRDEEDYRYMIGVPPTECL